MPHGKTGGGDLEAKDNDDHQATLVHASYSEVHELVTPVVDLAWVVSLLLILWVRTSVVKHCEHVHAVRTRHLAAYGGAGGSGGSPGDRNLSRDDEVASGAVCHLGGSPALLLTTRALRVEPVRVLLEAGAGDGGLHLEAEGDHNCNCSLLGTFPVGAPPHS